MKIQAQCHGCGDVEEVAEEELDDILAAGRKFLCWDCVTQIYDEVG